MDIYSSEVQNVQTDQDLTSKHGQFRLWESSDGNPFFKKSAQARPLVVNGTHKVWIKFWFKRKTADIIHKATWWGPFRWVEDVGFWNHQNKSCKGDQLSWKWMASHMRKIGIWSVVPQSIHESFTRHDKFLLQIFIELDSFEMACSNVEDQQHQLQPTWSTLVLLSLRCSVSYYTKPKEYT